MFAATRMGLLSSKTGLPKWGVSAAVIGNWNGLAMSSDGSKLFATNYGRVISKSLDFGATWSQCTAAGSRSW